MKHWILLCALLLGILPVSVRSGTPSDSLRGLWKANRWFGPYIRGPVILYRTGNSSMVDVSGKMLPVKSEKGELSFEVPDGEGSFVGRFEDGNVLAGHWYPPPSSAIYTGGTFASPLRLTPNGTNEWRGTLVPFEDVFSFYLLIQKKADGTLSALLRNPERDYGSQIGVERISIEGNGVTVYAKRQGQAERQVATGTYDSARQTMSISFPDRGGSYDFTRDGDESDFYPRGKQPVRYSYHPPPSRDDGWPTGTLAEANIDQAGIEKYIQKICEMRMDTAGSIQEHAILIARHGKLVLEEYFHGENRDKTHDTRSAAKSVTSTIVGAAMEAGAPLTPSTPVYKLMNGGTFPDTLDSLKRSMTLENLLTMTSGFFCDDANPDAPGNEDIMTDQSVQPDYYKFTLALPMATVPGEHCVYCSCNPNLALGMVSKATGEDPMYTFDRLVATPMRITRYGWLLDPLERPYGGGSINFLPRDFMKFGQLMLNGGTWEGHRILSKEYVARASSPLYHLRGVYYGYLWWGIEFPYKNRTVYAFYAGGAGGQSVMVVPELDLVIATFAANYNSNRVKVVQQEPIAKYILPCVREDGDDKNTPVIFREDYVSPYGPSPSSAKVTKEENVVH